MHTQTAKGSPMTTHRATTIDADGRSPAAKLVACDRASPVATYGMRRRSPGHGAFAIKASRVALFVACWIGTGAIAHAQTTRTWNVTSGTWSTASNWDGGTMPSSTDTAVFSGAAVGSGATTVYFINSTGTIGGMTFNTGTTTLRGDTANRTLTLGTNGITIASTAGTVTIGDGANKQVNLLLSGSQTWTNNSGNAFSANGLVNTVGTAPVLLTLDGTSTAGSTLGAAISGNAGREISIRKIGAGLWTFSGNNTYAGTTTIEQGTLKVNSQNGLGSGGGGTVVMDGANLQINTTGTIAENISIAGAGIAGGVSTSVGALNASLNPGLAVTFSGSISLTANATIAVYGGQDANSSASLVTFSNGISGIGDLTLRSIAANNGRATFTLNGQSSYTGNTIFSTTNVSGTFTVQSGTDNALPTTTVLNMAASAPTGKSGSLGTVANYRLGGFKQTLAGLTGGTSGGSGTTAYSNIVTGGSSSALSTLTLAVTSGTSYIFAGTLGGAGTDENNLALVKSGAGTQTLTGNNTYTGLTTISGGTLSVGAGGGSGELTGNVLNNAALVFNRSGTSTYAGNISGSGLLRKLGAGTVKLTGSHSHSGGTTVSEGTLSVNGYLGGSSALVVRAGAAVGGSGVIAGGITGDGQIGPGNSPGILTVQGQVAPTASTSFAFEFSGTGAPVWSSDTASVNDVLRLTNAVPFASNLASTNIVNIYFEKNVLASGDAFLGGFFVDNPNGTADLLSTSLGAAIFNYFVLGDGNGQNAYNGKSYYTLDQYIADHSGLGITGVTPSVVSVSSAAFTGGPAVTTGSVTQFVIVPEPGALALAGLGIGLAGWMARHRRRFLRAF